MAGRECFHCKAWIVEGQAHDCWTTTEAALTRDLPEDLKDAWERLRETAAAFGEQRIYASLNSIMFARKVCYCFVRPRPKRLEVCFFLGRSVTAPQIKKVLPASRVKRAHLVHVMHRDEVEPPLTDWLREAYDVSPSLSAPPKRDRARVPAAPAPRHRSGVQRRRPKRSRTPPFVTTLVRYPGKGGWTFAIVPPRHAPPVTRPWGRTPVHASVDGVAWETSLWRDRKRKGALLPVPKRIRGAKGGGDRVVVEFTFERDDD